MRWAWLQTCRISWKPKVIMSVGVAHDGGAALALCHERAFDLAIVDIKLPDIEGTELIGRLAQLLPEMEYILVTGYASLESAIKAAGKEKVIAYETKPLDLDRLLVFIRQVAARKKAEEEKKESEEKYRALIQVSMDAIIIGNEERKIVSWNRGAEKIFGYNAEEAMSHNLYELIVPSQYSDERKLKELREFHENETIPALNYAMEFTSRRKDGTEFPIELSLARRQTTHGWQTIAIVRDITEHKRAEEQLERSFVELAETTSRAMACRDPYTTGHQRRVAGLARLVGEKMGLESDALQGLYIGGLLHDIGKISVPESILTKPGKLSEEEWALVRSHARQGYEILKETTFPWPVAGMALHHHERLDGSGYPDGLSGDELSLEVRILGVCDVVEAMSSFRPYRPARSKEEVIEEIKEGSGTKYDDSVVDVVLKVIESGEFELGQEDK